MLALSPQQGRAQAAARDVSERAKPRSAMRPAPTQTRQSMLPGESVPFQVAVHDGEEHLEEEVDRIYDDGEEE